MHPALHPAAGGMTLTSLSGPPLRSVARSSALGSVTSPIYQAKHRAFVRHIVLPTGCCHSYEEHGGWQYWTGEIEASSSPRSPADLPIWPTSPALLPHPAWTPAHPLPRPTALDRDPAPKTGRRPRRHQGAVGPRSRRRSSAGVYASDSDAKPSIP